MTVKFPIWSIETPLDYRLLERLGDEIPQGKNAVLYKDGNEFLADASNLITIDEAINVIVNWTNNNKHRINRLELSAILWLLVYKDLSHGRRFFPPVIPAKEFSDIGPNMPFEIVGQTVAKHYGKNYAANITKPKPVQGKLTNAELFADPQLAQTYIKPIRNYYFNQCDAHIVSRTDTTMTIEYSMRSSNYGMSLQAWLDNNLPVAYHLVKSNDHFLVTASIINSYTNAQRARDLGSISAKEIATLPALQKYKLSTKQLLHFLNI